MRLPIILILAQLAVSPASAASSFESSVREVIGDPKGLDAPGCAVGIFDRNSTKVYAAGSANVASRRPLDGDTQFYSASVGKQFTALAIAQLVVQGKIRLSDDVRQYLPELPTYRAPITVAMLLHHTAGIRETLSLGALAGYATSAALPRDAALDLVMRQRDTNSVPGSRYEYSNGGYLLLAEIVQRVARQPFSDYVNERILKPMQMSRSYVLTGTRPDGPNVANGYVPQDGQFLVRNTHPLFGGAGGLFLTINDMAKYHRDIYFTQKVWSPAIRKILETPGVLSNGSPVVVGGSRSLYAGGLMIDPDWIHHGGAAEGFANNYARLRSDGRGIAIFCNRPDVDPLEKAQLILSKMGSNFPKVDLASVEPPEANGRFVSDEIPIAYMLTTANGKLTVTLEQPAGGGTVAPMTFTRLIDGSYLADDRRSKLVLDPPNDAFTISTFRAAGIRFQRAK